MKKSAFSLLAMVIALTINAQAPNSFSYQAVLRNSDGTIKVNEAVSIQIEIIQGSIDGTSVYLETHNSSTNTLGLVTLEIGSGTTSDNISSINWNNGPYFLNVLVNESNMGATQLLSVPYALHANSAENITGEIEFIETDPVFSASQAANITTDDISNLSKLSGTNSGDQDLSLYATKDMQNQNITNLADPVDDLDATNKAYVDELKEQIEELQILTGAVVKDNEGNKYKTVTIGTQVWMAENLKTTKYADGTSIPLVADNLAWEGNSTGARCWYNNDSISYAGTYGALYNWYAVNNSSKLCPAGWHVPTDAEWTILENYMIANGHNYDGSTTGNKIGKSLASTTLWWPSTNEGAVGNSDFPDYRNLSGFNGYPGGGRSEAGGYSVMGGMGYWWSFIEDFSDNSLARRMDYNWGELILGAHKKTNGYSVRCLKNSNFTRSSDVFGLYTIKTGTDELYFIDLSTNNMTKVANIGIVIPNMFTGMQYKDDKLYIASQGKLFTYDLSSGILSHLISNIKIQWQFSINDTGELYSVTEVSGPAQGSMYKIDIASNTSTLIGTTGTASLWGMGFDSTGQLWAVDELHQKYGTMNTTNGKFTQYSSAIPYTDTYYSTPDNDGNLYSFNVGAPRGFVKYNIASDNATLILPSNDSWGWAGLAYGPLYTK